jgi:hypothetical protein
MYQALDPSFVGIIVSCFHGVSSAHGSATSPLVLTCFQAVDVSAPPHAQPMWERTHPQLEIGQPESFPTVPAWQGLCTLQQIMCGEEREAYVSAVTGEQADSAIARVHHAAMYERGLCVLAASSVQPLATAIAQRRASAKSTLERLAKERDALL